MAMRASQNCEKLIAKFEGGIQLLAYQDERGIWTIGVGHTPASRGQSITQEQAMVFFSQDIQTSEVAVNSGVSVPLTQNMFDALVSFTFNVGAGTFLGSMVRGFLNAGHYDEAAADMTHYNVAGSGISKGLVNRRMAEVALFRTPDA